MTPACRSSPGESEALMKQARGNAIQAKSAPGPLLKARGSACIIHIVYG